MSIKLDISHTNRFITKKELEEIKPEIEASFNSLVEGRGEGNDFLGWVDYPINQTASEYQDIIDKCNNLKDVSDILVVLGIGGSYLGARAVINSLLPSFENKVLFAGNNMSSKYLRDMLEYVNNKNFSIVVISKSGKTLETAVAFRLLRNKLIENYGEDGARKRIVAITDENTGLLKTLADKNNYPTLPVPNNIGGRYSVLTAVGLFPIHFAGIDTKALLDGARAEREHLLSSAFAENEAMIYAACRNLLYRKALKVELITSYEPSSHYLLEWWAQLFGESEGKNHKGLFPSCADLTQDLHSVGQFIQDGSRVMVETVINFEDNLAPLSLTHDDDDIDRLNYLSGKDIDFINKSAMYGSVQAHEEGDVPVMMVNVPSLDAYNLGALLYFFEFACAISGYTLGVNPFNQPGVETYKQHMQELLNK